MISAPTLISKQRHGVSEVTGAGGERERGTTALLSDPDVDASMVREIRFGVTVDAEETALLNNSLIFSQI